MLKSLSPSNVRVNISNRSSGLGDTSVVRVKVSHMSPLPRRKLASY
jgi:hypothetical protein